MRTKHLALSLALVGGLSVAQSAFAAPAQVPIFLMAGTESLVMLNMSNDHQLFYKAYDDWSDVDEDGDLDTTYEHGIDYYGYFDAYKCYTYDATDGRFEPAATTNDKYCSAGSSQWSGNFLNWASMARIDTVRKILFGGLRSTDTSSVTVLERTYLPSDAHSFAKYYQETMTGELSRLTPYASTVSEITICNTTYDENQHDISESSDEPPLLRVAEGNFALWAANERYQCRWHDEEATRDIFESTGTTLPDGRNVDDTNNGNDPAVTGLDADPDSPNWTEVGAVRAQYIARVQVCVDGLIGTENCKKYPTSTHRKPIGLLQQYGDDGDIKFGLMTGSFQNNKSGGTLRKNVGAITDEINTTTDGTFKNPPATGNIIGTLSTLTVSGYDPNEGVYNTQDNCIWGLDTFNNGSCTNWGNPQSEIYLESLRYFAGDGNTADFNADDTSFVPNLISATSWTDPLNNTNYCAPVKVIQFNASVTSYDDDELTGVSDLESFGSLDDWTNKVGTGEGIPGNAYFIGEGTTESADFDGLCTAKTLSNLADAEGLCPEAPRLEGGFDIAGMAYYARTETIRDDLTDVDGNEAVITVDTFGVTLSPAVPKIEVPISNSSNVVTILPACRNANVGGNCAIVDFKVAQQHTETAPNSGVFTGRFYVNWEDSEQGGDYDMDMSGIIEYELRENASEIDITTFVFADSTGSDRLGFGYVISGTTADGFHVHSGINEFVDYDDPSGVLACGDEVGGDTNVCETGEPRTTVTYDLGASSGTLLEAPLYYAAKWGGFEEEDNPVNRPLGAAAPNGKPDQDYEWKNASTGLPKNYFFSRNPGQLSSQLESVFEAVATVSSSASVVANSVSLQTTTRIYQARFDSTDWSGKLLSFPVNLTTGGLEDWEWDAGIEIADQNANGSTWNSGGRVFVTWNGSAGVSLTWTDAGTDPTSVVDLTAYDDDTTGLSVPQRLALDTDPDDASNIDGLGVERLNYIRGDFSNEISEGGAFRSRRKEVTDETGTKRTVFMPLGDVVHSTPTIVGAPNFGYRDKIPGTTTDFESSPYSGFKTKFANSECFLPDGVTRITTWAAGSSGAAGSREPMVYFGANDGALHGVSACTGVERLAFVPETVFSNLNKLTDPDYAHLYYVDGAPTVVDAFWNYDWHTVLLGTLGAGGKAVFALDVTDPSTFSESTPANIVLWEKNHEDTGYGDLGYSFSQPAIIKAEGHGWVAVFGNGYDSANGKAVLYVARIYDGALLATIDLSGVDATAHDVDTDAPVPNGLSTLSPIDTDGDGDVDLMYGGDLNGNVWRFAATAGVGFSGTTTSLLYTAKNSSGDRQPITSRFAVGRHPTSAVGRLVYFGTGKYYEIDDQDPSNAVVYNSMYGLWDRDIADSSPASTLKTIPSVTTRNSATLQKQEITLEQAGTFGTNSFDVRIVSQNPITWVSQNTLGNWNSCSSSGSCGWYLDLETTGEKMVANPILRGGRLIFVTTIPSLVPCAAGGTGWLMEIDPNTGGRLDEAVFDLNGDGVFDFNDNLNTGSDGSPVYTPVSGKKSKVGILQPPAILSGIGGSGDGSYGGKEGKYSSGSKDAQIDVTIENPGLLGAGRKSWVRIK